MPEHSSPEARPHPEVEAGGPHAPLVLNGVLERQQFPPLLTAVITVVAAFFLYQLIGSVALLVLLLQQGVPVEELVGALDGLFAEYSRGVLVTNAIAQVFGLAAPALLMARLHASRPAAFLRFRAPDASFLVLSLLGLAALTPVVLWLGAFNESLPVPQPEWLRELERVQVELLERVLTEEVSLGLNLLLMAVTPAFCEEILFRGYVQRQSERALGVFGGILFSGILFGLFHFRLTQLIPLTVLGLYLGYIVWRSGSLWPAIAVHFANNAMAVWLAPYFSAAAEEGADPLETMPVPAFLLIAGLVFFILILYYMHRRVRQEVLQEFRQEAARPAHPPSDNL